VNGHCADNCLRVIIEVYVLYPDVLSPSTPEPAKGIDLCSKGSQQFGRSIGIGRQQSMA
jgi:hypothetical protein